MSKIGISPTIIYKKIYIISFVQYGEREYEYSDNFLSFYVKKSKKY